MAKAKTAKRKTTAKRAVKTAAATRPTKGRKVPARDDGEAFEPGSTSLVIVESPAKAKTIGKYLGRAYRVRATVGYVRDLPEKKMGIDIENGFEPEYVTIPGKEKTVADLKSAARDSREIFLATDPDRVARGAADQVEERCAGQACSLPRDHARCGAAGDRQRRRDRRTQSGCTAGASCSRPAGRLQGQPRPLENSEEGDFGRARADRGASAPGRTREGNPRVQAGRVLDGRGAAGKRQAAIHGEATSARRQEACHQQRARGE